MPAPPRRRTPSFDRNNKNLPSSVGHSLLLLLAAATAIALVGVGVGIVGGAGGAAAFPSRRLRTPMRHAAILQPSHRGAVTLFARVGGRVGRGAAVVAGNTSSVGHHHHHHHHRRGRSYSLLGCFVARADATGIGSSRSSRRPPHSQPTAGRCTVLFESSSRPVLAASSCASSGMVQSRAMASSNDDGGLPSSLAGRLATRLVRGHQRRPMGIDDDDDDASSSNAPSLEQPNPMRAVVAVAGGGSGAASAIAAVPGASSILLESIVAYDRKSFAEFVSNDIDRDEGLLSALESSDVSSGGAGSGFGNANDGGPSSRSSSSDVGGVGEPEPEEFKFCSAGAAVLLSRSALRRSAWLTPSFRDRGLHCIGVGCTSSLVGALSSEGEEIGRRKGRKSRAYIACSTLREGTWVWEARLDGYSSPIEGSTTPAIIRRSRLQEESLVSNLVLLGMIRHRERTRGPLDEDDVRREILDRDGDEIVETKIENGDVGSCRKSAADGASRIVDGSANIVAVLPVPERPGQEAARMEALFSDGEIPLVRDFLVVPGSFNPPHQGHVGLAKAAVSALRRIRREEREQRQRDGSGDPIKSSGTPYSRYASLSSASSSSSSSVLKSLWSTVEQHAEEGNEPTVFFEMSVTNADKPPLDPAEVGRRADMFASSLPASEMPDDWAMILTNAPLFSQKAEMLHGLLAAEDGGAHAAANSSFGSSSSSEHHQTTNSVRRMTFVIGTDTMVRIINPKYYGDSWENMLRALADMREMGVHFIVGGRLEQGAGGGNIFVNGEEEAESLPSDARKMFTLLTEEEFRLDISSTELRKKLKNE